MMTTTKAKRAEVAPLVNATFPEYRGRTFHVLAATTVYLSDLNWSGGSRSQYRTCTLDGRPLGPSDRNPAEGQRLPVPRGAVVVRHSIFCGRDTGLTFYVHPDDLPKWLPHKAA